MSAGQLGCDAAQGLLRSTTGQAYHPPGVRSCVRTKRKGVSDVSTQIKTALVTGSSSGIGLDIARAFLDEGSNVVLNGRNADEEIVC